VVGVSLFGNQCIKADTFGDSLSSPAKAYEFLHFGGAGPEIEDKGDEVDVGNFRFFRTEAPCRGAGKAIRDAAAARAADEAVEDRKLDKYR
jgi:hypothetical protein